MSRTLKAAVLKRCWESADVPLLVGCAVRVINPVFADRALDG